jgi:GDP-L-fucose synthase
MNVGTGKDITIKELWETIKTIVWYTWDINRDTSKPNGTPRKLLDVSRLSNEWWDYTIELEAGIRKTVEWFLNSNANA